MTNKLERRYENRELYLLPAVCEERNQFLGCGLSRPTSDLECIQKQRGAALHENERPNCI